MEKITQIYELSSLGYDELIQELNSVNLAFEKISQSKREAGRVKEKIVDPKELDEAAKIDGASAVQTYWLIFMPLAAPVLAVVALLSFIGTFNEFILARLFLVDMESRTVAVGLQQFIGGQYSENWGPFAAGSIIASVPIVIIFLSLQKYIVNGLTAGSVKG